MQKYIIRRLILFFPTLLSISMLGFWLCQLNPSDSLSTECEYFKYKQDLKCREKIKMRQLDLPLFYIGLSTLAEPDTLYKIYHPTAQKTFKKLLQQTGNWQNVQHYKISLEKFQFVLDNYQDETDSTANFLKNQAQSHFNLLIRANNQTEIKIYQDSLANSLGLFHHAKALIDCFTELKSSSQNCFSAPTRWKNYVPYVHFYGFNNRYHHWITHFFMGDWGKSYISSRPVISEIYDYIWRSLSLAVAAAVLSLVLGIFMGIILAKYHDSTWSKFWVSVLFWIETTPSFVIATILLFLFANPQILNWFSAEFEFNLAGFMLPLVAYSLHGLIQIALVLQMQIQEEKAKDYVRTAYAKGLSENDIFLKHILKNAVLPLTISIARLFPALIGGSAVLEMIFSVAGMGQKTVEAVLQKDIPIVTSIFMLTAILTLLGYFFADLMAFYLNPKTSHATQ